jgi:hypothetical protein
MGERLSDEMQARLLDRVAALEADVAERRAGNRKTHRSPGRRVGSPGRHDAMEPGTGSVMSDGRADDGFSRRGLLRRLGGAAAAGAGLAAGAAVLGATPAAATDPNDVVLGGSNDAVSAQTSITSTNATLGTFLATNTGTGNAVNGVINNASSLRAAVAGSTNGPGPGVVGAGGIGVEAAGTSAQLYLVPPISKVGAPTTGAHFTGEVFVDTPGAIFQCVGDGDFATATHPVFVRIGLNPISPVRLVGTGTGQGGGLNAYAGHTIAGGGTLVVKLAGTLDPPVSQPSPVPIQASAVVFTLLAIQATSTTDPIAITIYPADVASAPAAYSIYARTSAASTEVTAKLGVGGGNAGKVKIFNREPDPVDVYVDVTGFYS